MAEEKELALVGKVELRIAMADSDAKLESILNTYLPPLLLKLASEFGSVRNKVRSVFDAFRNWCSESFRKCSKLAFSRSSLFASISINE